MTVLIDGQKGKGCNMTLSIEERQKICRLRKEGRTQREIAKMCDCHPNTVYLVLKAEAQEAAQDPSSACCRIGASDDDPTMKAIRKELEDWKLRNSSGSTEGLVFRVNPDGSITVQAADPARTCSLHRFTFFPLLFTTSLPIYGIIVISAY